ncbi:platelet-activating factor acetylhydrolase, isoform II-domain-containing protein [Kalaharituber pfeilii]|nr:platelet-activating factor acetylhydrolase, isoform II-domain-containing protein [Kalaharituber pfeilii]
MPNWFPRVVPAFPPLAGPYPVGTVEIEIPVSSLVDGVGEDDGFKVKVEGKEGSIETILFRVFYPATGEYVRASDTTTTSNIDDWNHDTHDAKKFGWKQYIQNILGWGSRTSHHRRQPTKPVYWLPEQYQQEFLKGYLRFGGISREWLVDWIGRFPQVLYHVTIPAVANSPLHSPTNSRFPTMVFSHGLGGSRLAYSQMCSSIASYGVVVFALEHRDGSGPVSIIRKRMPNGQRKFKTQSVHYVTIPHQLTKQMSDGRDFQLSTRCTELVLLYKVITWLNKGIVPKGSIFGPDGDEVTEAEEAAIALRMFKDKLDVDTPGRVIWAGHSFGAATMVQFIKNVYYFGSEEGQFSLFTCLKEEELSGLRRQITKQSPLLLFDLWSLSLLGSGRTYWMWKKPLPQVLPLDQEEGARTPDAKNARVLVLMSQQFYVWKENMWAVKWLLSRNPGLRDGAIKEIFNYDVETAMKIEVDDIAVGTGAKTSTSTQPPPEEKETEQAGGYRPPKLFYAKKSAHLSQSDFNLLFPIFFRREVPDPGKVFAYNVRAAVQWLREAGYRDEVAPHSLFREEVDDDEIFEMAEAEGTKEKHEGERVLDGWVRLGLQEEVIKKAAVKKAVEESMEAAGEAELEGNVEEGELGN